MIPPKQELNIIDLVSTKKITGMIFLSCSIAFCGRPSSDEDWANVAAANNNGQMVNPLSHPSVVYMTGPAGNPCTGTLVGNNQVLTAGHCAFDASGKVTDPSRMRMRIGEQVYSPSGVNVHPEYVKNYKPNLDEHTREKNDLAIFTLPSSAKIPENTARNFGQPPSAGQRVAVVGYGFRTFGGTSVTTEDQPGILRRGTNTVGKVGDGLIELTPSGLGTTSYNAAATPNGKYDSTMYDPKRTQGSVGDSGGPLFNNKGEVIGVASGAFYEPNNLGPNGTPNKDYIRSTSYTELNHPSNKSWLDSQLKRPGSAPTQAQSQPPAKRPTPGQAPGGLSSTQAVGPRPAPAVGPRPAPAVGPRPAPAVSSRPAPAVGPRP